MNSVRYEQQQEKVTEREKEKPPKDTLPYREITEKIFSCLLYKEVITEPQPIII